MQALEGTEATVRAIKDRVGVKGWVKEQVKTEQIEMGMLG